MDGDEKKPIPVSEEQAKEHGTEWIPPNPPESEPEEEEEEGIPANIGPYKPPAEDEPGPAEPPMRRI